jgi:trimethylamine---corrinoid protein Co-methyltransferase
LAAQGGANIIYGAGMLENGVSVDLSKMVLDCEYIKMIRRIVSGIAIDSDALAMEIIKNVGPGGEFITHNHTLEHCRTSLSQSNFFDRQSREGWVMAGSKKIEEIADEKVLEILANHQVKPLEQRIKDGIREIVEK